MCIRDSIDTRDYETSRFLFFATKQGQVKKTKFTEYDSSRRDGLIAITLKDGDELVEVLASSGEQDVFLVSQSGQTMRFPEDLVRPMGRSAAGVRGMKLRAEDEVVAFAVSEAEKDLLIVTDAGYGKRTKIDKYPAKGRGGMGVKGIKITSRRGKVVSALMAALDDEVFLVSSGGVMIRMPVRDISAQGRDASGVRVMNLDGDEAVVAMAPVLKVEGEEDPA